MTLSKAEQETIINFSAADKTANIYTTDPTWIKKLEKLGATKLGDGVEIDVPKSWIKVSKR